MVTNEENHESCLYMDKVSIFLSSWIVLLEFWLWYLGKHQVFFLVCTNFYLMVYYIL